MDSQGDMAGFVMNSQLHNFGFLYDIQRASLAQETIVGYRRLGYRRLDRSSEKVKGGALIIAAYAATLLGAALAGGQPRSPICFR